MRNIPNEDGVPRRGDDHNPRSVGQLIFERKVSHDEADVADFEPQVEVRSSRRPQGLGKCRGKRLYLGGLGMGSCGSVESGLSDGIVRGVGSKRCMRVRCEVLNMSVDGTGLWKDGVQGGSL